MTTTAPRMRQLVDWRSGERTCPAGHDEVDTRSDIRHHMGGIFDMRVSRRAFQRLRYKVRFPCSVSGRSARRRPRRRQREPQSACRRNRTANQRQTARTSTRPDAGQRCRRPSWAAGCCPPGTGRGRKFLRSARWRNSPARTGPGPRSWTAPDRSASRHKG